MTYSEMIFAMDDYRETKSKRGRKPYLYDNEHWTIEIITNFITIKKSNYCKKEEEGRRWVAWKLNEFKRKLEHNNIDNRRYGGSDEYVKSYTVTRVDRMGRKTTEKFNAA